LTIGLAAVNTVLIAIPVIAAIKDAFLLTEGGVKVAATGAKVATEVASETIAADVTAISAKEAVVPSTLEIVQPKTIEMVADNTLPMLDDAAQKLYPNVMDAKGLKFNFSSEIKAISSGVDDAAKGGSHLVYEGLDASGKVKYVGITGRDAAVRFSEHLNSVGTGKELLRYRVIDGATGLSKSGARVWEQTLMNQYGLGKNGGMLLNKINSIAPTNWWLYGIK
jgi:hypothetical protein